MQVDVVCGSEVEADKALTIEHDGRTYCFCSEECLEAFQDDPEEFTEEAQTSA